MPFSHALILCFGYVFGSLVAELLKAQGFLEYAFYVDIPPGKAELKFAIFQSVIFCTTLLVGQKLLGRVPIRDTLSSQEYLEKLSNYSLLALVFTVLFSVFLTVYYWDEMMAESTYRHGGNHHLSRTVLLLTLVVTLFFHRTGYAFRCVAFFFVIYMGTMSGAIGASRSALIPFMLAGISFLQRKNYVTGMVLIYLGLVALRTAFGIRGDPSYFNFWEYYLAAVFKFDVLDYLRVAFQYSSPGLTTIQAAMYDPGSFSLDSIGRFILYVSPVPSFILPSSLFSDLSLSYALGIDRAVVGINYDIFSEGIYWFGVNGAWFFTLVLSLIALVPYYIASRILISQTYGVYIICLLANIWMVFGGQVFILRSGSRAVIALSIVLIVIYVARRLRLRSRLS